MGDYHARFEEGLLGGGSPGPLDGGEQLLFPFQFFTEKFDFKKQPSTNLFESEVKNLRKTPLKASKLKSLKKCKS